MRKFLSISMMLLFLSGCSVNTQQSPNTYKHQEKDVINTHGSIENIEQLDQFVDDVNNEEVSKVRVVHYTIEGDPIFLDITYDGTSIQSRHDSTKDQYGSGEITEQRCERITKNETDTETSYELECGEETKEILHFQYDTEQQDKFEFQFKYGVNKKNDVDTVNQKLVKDLQNGETVTVSDFQFNRKELNQIYKAMVLANYLDEKNLTSDCNQKPHESYELTVWINGAERHFEWSECDKSKHGLQMKKMKNEIIRVIEENETYKTLPPTQGGYK